MNVQAYFMIIWYILVLPIVFKMLMSLQLEKLFIDYFIDIFTLLKSIF